MPDAVANATPREGLSEEEAARRLAAVPSQRRQQTSRSTWSIVRANVFTIFNLILVVFGVLTLGFGDWRDSLFLGILVGNTAIGIVQETRAKRALDRLAALVAPTATVVRDGRERRIPVSEVVVGDRLRLAPGDQVVADGTLDETSGLALDESILTGESLPVPRHPGEEARSGSFAVEGTGTFTVTAVGAASFAERLAGEARRFRHPRSPLERALDRLLLTLVAIMVPAAIILGVALIARDTPTQEAVQTAVAGIVNLVPEGLILLTSLTFAVAALRMARRGALAQQLNAIESLASAEVVCLDKTGTITGPQPGVVGVVPAAGIAEDELADLLRVLAASATTRNSTLAAIALAYPGQARPLEGEVPFASRRRWSAARVDGATLVLGAPDVVPIGDLAARASAEASQGRRVVALARSETPLDDDREPALPPGLAPVGLVLLGEHLRADARETVAFLRREGVELKILSGDDPVTVARIAVEVGIAEPGTEALDGRTLPDEPDELARVALAAPVIGRIDPDGKRRVVEALRDSGKYVAMVGDGVNDVPALKAARLAIAQGSGAQMARSVADLVLVSGDFSAVPTLVHEGRKILRNVQRVAKLFVAKSVFAAILVLSIGVSSVSYPFIPRHLTIVSVLAIGVPAFFVALAPSAGAWRPDSFLRDVARFSIPAGLCLAAGVVGGYLLALWGFDLGLLEARTVSTSILFVVGLVLILSLEAVGTVRTIAVGSLCATMGALYLLALGLPQAREFFDLTLPGPEGLIAIAAGIALALAGLFLAGLMPWQRTAARAAHLPSEA